MIPANIRADLNADPFMRACIHRKLEGASPCDGRIEYEHAHVYAGKQINERWAIVPVCTRHHRGGGLMKNYNRFASMQRMTEAERKEAYIKYPRTDWTQLRTYLYAIYAGRTRP